MSSEGAKEGAEKHLLLAKDELPCSDASPNNTWYESRHEPPERQVISRRKSSPTIAEARGQVGQQGAVGSGRQSPDRSPVDSGVGPCLTNIMGSQVAHTLHRLLSPE